MINVGLNVDSALELLQFVLEVLKPLLRCTCIFLGFLYLLVWHDVLGSAIEKTGYQRYLIHEFKLKKLMLI